MMHPRTPEGGELADVMDFDAEIEALRGGARRSQDPVLNLIVGLRDDIDSRTAFLLGQADLTVPAGSPPTSEFPSVPRSWDSENAVARRRARRRRLVVLPAAGILVLGSTGVAAALSGSRQAPLYSLHQLIFGSAPSSDQQISRDLADAGQLLDRAAALPLDQRPGSLNQARVILGAARNLLPAASSSTVRTTLSHEITLTELRAYQLGQRPAPVVRPTPGPGLSTPEPSAGPSTEEPTSPGDAGESSAPAAIGVDGGAETEPAESQATPAPSTEPAAGSGPAAQPERQVGDGSPATAGESEPESSEAPDN